ncbi:uracil phosphoribosyltransferase [Pyrenophora seminiperda CCB06]|uniref:uracil phosphoribosyltransferase n=1 Tax=Pyrenophora seminiperda CCB06 TaxID=1302712 RepID=A0A3M7MAK8_9PLEO|nr:uracil phosphoribosyltransferase [Pyrenophora seminiperda CCB06]
MHQVHTWYPVHLYSIDPQPSHTMAMPKNAHVSTHPCLQAKLSQLRSASTGSKDAQTLVHELALMVGYEALGATLKTQQDGTDKSPLGYEYTTATTWPSPDSISLVPILRSGLSMVPALASLLPTTVPIHHLGLYREKSTLQPVEYYNNLPYHTKHAEGATSKPQPELAIIVDPIIATGATACAAIDTLKDWGVKRIIVCSILATEEGLQKACSEWEDGVQVWVGGCDKDVDDKGMIKPGLGDIGDRLFLTLGK